MDIFNDFLVRFNNTLTIFVIIMVNITLWSVLPPLTQFWQPHVNFNLDRHHSTFSSRSITLEIREMLFVCYINNAYKNEVRPFFKLAHGWSQRETVSNLELGNIIDDKRDITESNEQPCSSSQLDAKLKQFGVAKPTVPSTESKTKKLWKLIRMCSYPVRHPFVVGKKLTHSKHLPHDTTTFNVRSFAVSVGAYEVNQYGVWQIFWQSFGVTRTVWSIFRYYWWIWCSRQCEDEIFENNGYRQIESSNRRHELC